MRPLALLLLLPLAASAQDKPSPEAQPSEATTSVVRCSRDASGACSEVRPVTGIGSLLAARPFRWTPTRVTFRPVVLDLRRGEPLAPRFAPLPPPPGVERRRRGDDDR